MAENKSCETCGYPLEHHLNQQPCGHPKPALVKTGKGVVEMEIKCQTCRLWLHGGNDEDDLPCLEDKRLCHYVPELASVKASTEKEIMPLITKEQLNEMAIKEHINSFSGLTVAEFAMEKQRDADQKVLESAQVMMDSMIKLIEKLEAAKKEWAKKEADWLLHLYINMTAIDGRTKEDIQARLDYLAELRRVGGEK